VTEKRQDRASLGSTDSPSGAAPERMCVVTRESGDSRDLIRFVLSPDGVVVPDLDRKLPGRGVWVGCDRTLVEKAIRTQAFSKSLKTKAEAPADLAERVENLILKRATGALSLANKAGLAVAGFEKVFAALEKGPVRVVLHGADAAADGRSKIDRKYKAIQADRGQPAAIVDVLTIAQMSLAIGRGSVVHGALTPGGLSDRFLEEAERLARYRHSTIEASPDGGARTSDFLAEG
jgi:predicted RNA-binding protein YlxR (DUF448 family)